MANPTTTLSRPSPADFDVGPGSEALELVRDPKQHIADQPSQQSAVESEIQDRDHSIQLLEVEIDRLHASSFQPRRRFSEDSLRELAVSLEKTGVLQPIIVRRHKTLQNHFEIVAGERRWRAAKLAKLPLVPVIVRELSDLNSLELALVENVQRVDLTPIERAEAYQRLLTGFGYTQEGLSLLLGKSRSHVANTLRLVNLPSVVKELVQSGELSSGHARALLSAEDPEKLAKRVISQKLSVRKVEALNKGPHDIVAGLPSLADKHGPSEAEDPILSALLNRRVMVSCVNETYTIAIHCKTIEEFFDFIGQLKSSWSKKQNLGEESETDSRISEEDNVSKRNVDAYGPEPKPMTAEDWEKIANELGCPQT